MAKYDKWLEPDGLTLLKAWTRDGLTLEQIAHNMGINVATLHRWKNRFSDICNALKEKQAVVDYEVENALLKRALGFEYEEVTTEIRELPDGGSVKHIKRVTKFVPPDVAAIIYWTKNRKPNYWADKKEITDTAALERLDNILSEVKANAYESEAK